MSVATIEHTTGSPLGAVSWSAVLAGAVAAAALSLILLILGTGLGLSSMSPWSHAGVSAQTLGVSTIVWLAFTQLAASGMGGYLAGRLRVRWSGIDGDEVYFRDTVHGFLAWGVASLATAALLGAAITSILGGGLQAVATEGSLGTAAQPAIAQAPRQAYFVDSLFRSDDTVSPSPSAAGPVSTPEERERAAAEAGRIFAQAATSGVLPQDDARYVGQLVRRHAGLPPADADKRANEVFVRMVAAAREAQATAREAADKARRASAHTALWLFVSVLFGAFVASFMATLGGRHRDLL